ncbi:IPT/TIG domain-containing protein [Spirosoma endbachense]|uniref:Cell shape determination protein CcmA n=1 Tax=Spirosoma endbachense TaxID=2666025 RepID=A0A6P1VSJ1_9BACT|nr:IPT/TIG domain-containing protein [Spirosoma endbachense]QHV96201.1 cell shape determination protein CcmA [Spirosoma endbachense]
MKLVSVVFAFLFLVLGISACRVKNAPPELATLLPKEAYVGQEITLGGYQFGDEPVVTFGGAGSAVVGQILGSSEQSIRVTVPLIAPGVTQVRVQTSEGISDPLPLNVLQPPPVITSITPSNGLPGTEVVITGSYLNQIQSLRFEQTPPIVKDSTANKLTLVVPEKIPHGPLNIVITTKGGETFTGFIVAGTPQITSISTKRAKPGSELIIQGQNLLDGLVRINGLTTDRNQTSIKDTEIRTVIPTNATSGKVTVTVFEKLVATSADSLQIVLQPAVANLSARDGITGDKIILTGLNLRDVSSVLFGTASVPFRVISDTQLEATVPNLGSPGQVTVSVTSVGGNASAADPFFFYVAPSNLVITPVRQLRLQPITITGQNLYRTTEVRVSGQVVSINSSIEGSQIIVSIPANAVSGVVTVTNRAGTATSQPLVVVQKALITDFLPAKARSGERVVVRGNFLLNAQFYFTGTTTPAADGGKNEDTERWILVPSDAQTGPIRVLNATNESVLTDTFTILRLATITDFTPKTAKAGEEITITGQNLANVTAVKFNGGVLPATFKLSGSSLVVTVPTGAVAGQICLTTEAGASCTSANFTPEK